MIQVVIAESGTDRLEQVENLVTGSGDIVLSQKGSDPEVFKSMLSDLSWQVCLLSMSYPFEVARELIVQLNRFKPDGKIILLSEDNDKEQILDLLSLGAAGFLDYNELDRFLIKAIAKVREGEAWIPRYMVASILERLTSLNSFSDLSRTGFTKMR